MLTTWRYYYESRKNIKWKNKLVPNINSGEKWDNEKLFKKGFSKRVKVELRRRNNGKAWFGGGGSRGGKGGGEENQSTQECFLIFNLPNDIYHQN